MVKGAPFVPTGKKNVEKMIKMVDLKPGKVLMDLGSGDGRILIIGAKTGAKCVGVEINPVLYHLSKLRTIRKDNIEIRREDLWQTNLSQVDVLTIYFINHKMDRLHKKIVSEMKPGSCVISYGFKFPNWQPAEKDGKIYLYKL